jgi:hypothetical protein
MVGVCFGSAGLTITHLLFADDSVVFLEANAQNLAALKGVLQMYESCSRHLVNFQKLSIFFGKGCWQEVREELKSAIGVTCEALSEKYLGLPIQATFFEADVNDTLKIPVSGAGTGDYLAWNYNKNRVLIEC